MRKRRKNRILRRLVLGLAVAAIVAPAAQAHLDEGTTQGNAAGSAAVINGDDKLIVETDGSAGVISGDDKVIVPPTHVFAGPIVGDDKVIVPRTDGYTGLVHNDDKVILPKPGAYAALGYRRALPEDYGNRTVAPVEAVRTPSSFDWGDALVGAGAAFALMLLAGAAALGTRRGRPATA